MRQEEIDHKGPLLYAYLVQSYRHSDGKPRHRADRNFDFPRVYQQKPLIEGVRVLKGARAFQHTHRRPFLEAVSQMEACRSATCTWIDAE